MVYFHHSSKTTHDDVDPLFLVALIQLELSGGRIGGGSELQTDPAVRDLFRNTTLGLAMPYR